MLPLAIVITFLLYICHLLVMGLTGKGKSTFIARAVIPVTEVILARAPRALEASDGGFRHLR
jgi:predicted kinase